MKNSQNVRATSRRKRKKQHIFDVTIRQSKERARRARGIFFGICKLLLLAALLAGAYVGGRDALRRFIWENPDYILGEDNISFHTTGTLTREDVLRTAGIASGMNIFKLQIGKAREAVNDMPQVDHVVVQRILPNRVTIDVTERNPIAWIAPTADEDPTTSGRAYLIDSRAIPMKPRAVLHQYLHLPVIYGFPVENLADGQRVAHYAIHAALELVRLNADNTRWQIQSIDVTNGYSLDVSDNRHIRLKFNLDGLAAQLARLNKLLDGIGDRQSELQTVNLFGERNTYVTYRPTADAVVEPTPGASATATPVRPTARISPTPPPPPVRRPDAVAPPRATSAPAPVAHKVTPIDQLKQPFRSSNGQR